MSQPAPENTPETQPAPSPPSPAPPVPSTPAPPQPRIGDANSFSVQAALASISDSLAALPERLVDSVREAAPPPAVVNTPQPTNQPPPTAPPATPPKRKSFGEWWFTK